MDDDENPRRSERRNSRWRRRESAAYVRIWNQLVDINKILQALIVRLIFGAHLALVSWLLVMFQCNALLWLVLLPWIFVFVEFVVSCKHEYSFKWVQPSVLAYLIPVSPAIWILENHRNSILDTNCSYVPNSIIFWNADDPRTTSFLISSTEQLLLLSLVFSRWFLPANYFKDRGKISQLLLVQIGRAADLSDIIDLFDAKRYGATEDASSTLWLPVALWNVSLFQFCIDFTARKKGPYVQSRRFRSVSEVWNYCLQTEIWTYVVAFCLQDGIFLALRLYLFFGCSIQEEDMIFFTSMNFCIILLSAYRVYTVLEERKPSVVEDSIRDLGKMFQLSTEQRIAQRFGKLPRTRSRLRFSMRLSLRRHRNPSNPASDLDRKGSFKVEEAGYVVVDTPTLAEANAVKSPPSTTQQYIFNFPKTLTNKLDSGFDWMKSAFTSNAAPQNQNDVTNIT